MIIEIFVQLLIMNKNFNIAYYLVELKKFVDEELAIKNIKENYSGFIVS